MIGLITGMGPQASVDFLQKIIDRTNARYDQEHIPLLISHATYILDRTQALDVPVLYSIVLKQLSDNIVILKNAGIQTIAMSCNTAHAFIKDLEKTFPTLNFLNIVELTAQNVANRYEKNSRIGILATSGTIKSTLYKNALDKYNLRLIKPNNQNNVDKAIYLLKKSNSNKKRAYKLIEQELQNLYSQNCEAVILGCTELPYILRGEKSPLPLIDSLEILASEIVHTYTKSKTKKQAKKYSPVLTSH